MFGRALLSMTVPIILPKSIVSDPLLLPATHSPGVAPETVFVLAAVIASRKVHKPSLPFAASEVLFRKIVLPAGVIALLSIEGGAGARLLEASRPAAALEPLRLGRSETNATRRAQMEMKSSARMRARSMGDNSMVAP
jgi:hypothetical protein